MIIFDKNTKNLEIPAGLGNLEINIISGATRYGVSSIDGQRGDLTLKTINGNELLGRGDIIIEGKHQFALFIFDNMTDSERVQMIALMNANPSVNDKYLFYKAYDIAGENERLVRLQFLYEVDGRYYFTSALADGQDSKKVNNFVCILASDGGISQADYHTRTIAEKTSELTNDSGFITSAETANFMTSAQTQEAISSALTNYSTTAQTATAIETATRNMVTKNTDGTTTYAQQIWTGTQAEYDALATHSNNILYFING